MGFVLYLALMAAIGFIGAPVVYNEPLWLAVPHLQSDLTSSYYQSVMSGIAIVGFYYALALLQAFMQAGLTNDMEYYFRDASDNTNKKGEFKQCNLVSTP